MRDRFRVKPQTGVIEEDPAVDFAGIHPDAVALGNDGNGLVQVKWNTQVLGKMVQRSQRKDAKGHVSSCQRRSHCIQGAVCNSTPGGLDEIFAAGCQSDANVKSP